MGARGLREPAVPSPEGRSLGRPAPRLDPPGTGGRRPPSPPAPRKPGAVPEHSDPAGRVSASWLHQRGLFLVPARPTCRHAGCPGTHCSFSHEDGTGDKVPNNHEPQPQNPLRQQQWQYMAVDCVDSELQLTLGWGWGRWAGGAGPGLGCWLWVQHRGVGGRAAFAQEAAAAPRGRWAGGRPQECRGDTGTQSVNTSAAVQPPGDVVGMRSEGSVRRAWVGLSQPRIYRRSGWNT